MHFKIKVSIYLEKEAKEKSANPQSNTALSWPLVLPSTHLLAAISRCKAPSGFKGSSRGNRSPRFRGPAGRGTAPLGKGGRGAEIHRRGQSAQRLEFTGFPKADFYQDCQADQKVWGSTWEGCVSAAQMPGLRGDPRSLECRAGFQEQGWPSRWPSDSFHPQHHKSAEFHPPIKLSVILEHFCELKQYAFYKNAPELS